ncbi:class F sortase [Cryobacterium sandaracinum]|uniref:Class F sortase n=1 Tax=Cryobacterium sandaracinum TaxID=1259247 RepID=A0ABY2JK23_9MICO|nr:class F sortase [Cryobacterium sandaracinum]
MIIPAENRRRGSRLATAAAVLLFTVGCTAIGFALWGNPPPPRPPASAAVSAPSQEPVSVTPSPEPISVPPTPRVDQVVGPTLTDSEPTQINVPAIEVDSVLMQLGQNPDGTVQTPSLDEATPAGWYTGSPTPGAIGPSVILGHVDSRAQGRAVFYRLGEMRPGDEILVTRADATVAVFVVDGVEKYPKDDFPQFAVYGNTDHAGLRLITCGGEFNETTRTYPDNVVVYASLVSSHAA